MNNLKRRFAVKITEMKRREFLLWAVAALPGGRVWANAPTTANEKMQLGDSPSPFASQPITTAQSEPQTIAELDGVEEFLERMRRHGFSADGLRKIFSQMRVNPRVISLMDAPADPARKVYWREYRRRRLAPRIVAEGARFMERHSSVLARAESEYGTPAEIIAAIFGVETRYGKVLGGFDTARALATLAFAYPRRAAEFRAELEELLLYAKTQGINPLQLRGSFAGAFGLPQFLPGSARRFAVDFDGDGRGDLFSAADAAGSIGNFLREHGWRRGGAVLYPVAEIPNPQPLEKETRQNGYKPTLSAARLAAAGVKAGDIAQDELYLLVDLENRYDTEYRLGAQNFYALTRYNKSFKYAAAVFDLASALREV